MNKNEKGIKMVWGAVDYSNTAKLRLNSLYKYKCPKCGYMLELWGMSSQQPYCTICYDKFLQQHVPLMLPIDSDEEGVK